MISSPYDAQNAYRQVQTDTASKEQSVVLLFEGAVRFLHQARQAMQDKHYEEQSHHIGRVQRILNELTCSLDPTHDEALTTSLRCCYTGMYNRLSEANIKDDVAALDEVTNLMSNFAQAWRQALESVAVGEEAAVAAG